MNRDILVILITVTAICIMVRRSIQCNIEDYKPTKQSVDRILDSEVVIFEKFHSLSPKFEKNKNTESRIIEPEGGPQWIKCWECDYEDQAVTDQGRDNMRNYAIAENDNSDNTKNNGNDFSLLEYIPGY